MLLSILTLSMTPLLQRDIGPPPDFIIDGLSLGPRDVVGFLLDRRERTAIHAQGSCGALVTFGAFKPVACRGASLQDGRQQVLFHLAGRDLDADELTLEDLFAALEAEADAPQDEANGDPGESASPAGVLYLAVPRLPARPDGLSWSVTAARDLPVSEPYDGVLQLIGLPGSWPCHIVPGSDYGSIAGAQADNGRIVVIPQASA